MSSKRDPVTLITIIENHHPVCDYEGCGEPAIAIAVGRESHLHIKTDGSTSPGHQLGVYCESHADWVENEGYPEHTTECPCCGCRFGVN